MTKWCWGHAYQLIIVRLTLRLDSITHVRILELHKALRKQNLDVSKAQKGELRIAEDQAVEMKRRVELQVRMGAL
jgi:hypothetical protein